MCCSGKPVPLASFNWFNACVSAAIGAAYFAAYASPTRSASFNTNSYRWLGTGWLGIAEYFFPEGGAHCFIVA